LVFVLALLTCSASAQLNITTESDATTLAQKITGPGVTILNAQYTGGRFSAGTFESVRNFPFNSGILLTSGRAKTEGTSFGANGVYTNVPTNGLGLPGDAALTTYSGKATFDACVLEFDFIPQGDSIKVNYIFSSEEYGTYTCTNYNDVFAFLISGPGFAQNTNIALVPNTTIPVSVNSINDGIPGPSGSIGTCNNIGAGSPFTQLYIKNRDNILTYNGYTVVLTAVAKVTPCNVYHIKLAIADASDGTLDSGVFLEASSFSSNGSIQVASDAALTDSSGKIVLVEGCKDARLKLRRANNSNNPFDVTIAYGGVAIAGTDFPLLPATVSFLATDTLKTLPLSAILDNIAEGTEKFTIYFSTGLACNLTVSDSLVVYIKDSIAFFNKKDTFACSAFPTKLSATTVNNTSNTYLWNDGSTADSINVTVPGIYTLIHTYSNTCFNIDTFKVVSGDPSININPSQTYFCEKDSLLLPVQTNADIVSWSTGVTANTTYAAVPGIYWSKGLSNNGCYVYDTISIAQWPLPLLNLGKDTALCTYETIVLNAFYPGATYTWSTTATSPALSISNKPGSYSVASNLNGCISRDTIVLTEKKTPIANAGPDVEIMYLGSAKLLAKDTSLNASYLWTPSISLSKADIINPIASPVSTTRYLLSVTSTDGCIATDEVEVKVIVKDFRVPSAFSPNRDGVNDRWDISLLKSFLKCRVQVFNRYGALVFQSLGYDTPFDGTSKGKDLPVGTYYYIIEPGNGVNRLVGSVTILR